MSLNFALPTDAYDGIFDATVIGSFHSVDKPTGWRVIIHGQPMLKKDHTHNFLYASLSAAKTRTESAFQFRFGDAFRKENGELWEECRAGKNGKTARDFYAAKAKAFRHFMNWVYQRDLVRYEEVKAA